MRRYCCFRFFLLSTKGITFAQTAKFFPVFTEMPTLTNEEYCILAAIELVKSLCSIQKAKLLTIKPAYKEKLSELASIFNGILSKQKQTPIPEIDYTTPPRVKHQPPRANINESTPLAEPTNATKVRTTPIIHQQTTQQNKPLIIGNSDDTTYQPTPRRSLRISLRSLAIILQNAIHDIVQKIIVNNHIFPTT